MRCSGSPTICTADNTARVREAAAQFEAVLFAAALAPLAKSLGFFGDVATGQVALSLARRDGALAATIERLLQR